MQDYHQLDIWRRAMAYTAEIYRFSAQLPDTERYNLAAQLRKAATSVPLNIAEGSGARPTPSVLVPELRVSLAEGGHHVLGAVPAALSRSRRPAPQRVDRRGEPDLAHDIQPDAAAPTPRKPPSMSGGARPIARNRARRESHLNVPSHRRTRRQRMPDHRTSGT